MKSKRWEKGKASSIFIGEVGNKKKTEFDTS